MKNRLSKVLAACGIASRRGAEEVIFDGAVKVNGITIFTPQTLVDTEVDHIVVKGRQIRPPESKIVYILNKPEGYICSSRRFDDDKLAIDLIGGEPRRLYTVGRLDQESKGLILVTNDGQLAQKLMHPSFQVEKEYIVKTKDHVTDEHIALIAKGTVVENTFCRPIRVGKINNFSLRVVVKDGKKHEVRCFITKAGLKVDELKRVRIGTLQLGHLPTGSYRELTEKEIKKHFTLKEAPKKRPPKKAPSQ